MNKRILTLGLLMACLALPIALAYVNTDLKVIKINQERIDLSTLSDYAGYHWNVEENIRLDVVYWEQPEEFPDFSLYIQGTIDERGIVTPTIAILNGDDVLDEVNKVKMKERGNKLIWKVKTDIEGFERMKFRFSKFELKEKSIEANPGLVK